MIDDLIEWHRRHFPLSTIDSQLTHLEQEIKEFEAADTNHVLEELADIYIVACSLKRWDEMIGFADEILEFYYFDFTEEYRAQIDDAIRAKMQVVANRVENGEYFWNGVDYDRKRW